MKRAPQSETGRSAEPIRVSLRNLNYALQGENESGWISKNTTKGNSEESVKVSGEEWLVGMGWRKQGPSTSDSVPSL